MNAELWHTPTETDRKAIQASVNQLEPRQQAVLLMWLTATLEAIAYIPTIDARNFTAVESAKQLIESGAFALNPARE